MSSSTKSPCRVLTFDSCLFGTQEAEAAISVLIREGYRIASTTDNAVTVRVFMVLDEARPSSLTENVISENGGDE